MFGPIAEFVKYFYWDGAVLTWVVWVTYAMARGFWERDWANDRGDLGAAWGLLISAVISGFAWPVGAVVMPVCITTIAMKGRQERMQELAEAEQRRIAPHRRELDKEFNA